MDASKQEANAPDPPITDADRQAKIDRVQHALAHDIIAFAEVDDRFDSIFRAESSAELEAAVRDLPVPHQPPPPVAQRHIASGTSFALIGDVKIGGWLAVGRTISATTLIGDIIIDVSSASIPAEGLTITTRQLIGDTKIILPDGARVQLNMIAVIGDRREVLVAPMPGGPTITITSFGLIGDAKAYSLSALPKGKLRRAWATFRRATAGGSNYPPE